MYIQFFNLREMPFAITPDPAYLYLSPRHQEALGHLLYGTGQYGGFVQLTGEVGTGKTTVVRTLLEQKLGEVDVAIIHNPRLNEREFVQSICDELGVSYPPDATLKPLIDVLNRHLLTTHAAGRRTVLIIDEAQNLARDVLEQVRLLTNLETPKEKLLRIMLIGQPELVELLSRPDLRQLASRITARYHLMPLSEAETGEYIRHRLRVAGTHEEIFPPTAIRDIHRYSRGVPRLINILCDRALLGAYGQGIRKVTPQMVRKAATESLGAAPSAGRERARPTLAWVEGAVLVGAAALALILLYRAFAPATAVVEESVADPPGHSPIPPASRESEPLPAALPQSAPWPQRAPDPGPEIIDLTVLLQSTQPLPVVMSRLIRRWDSGIRVARGENVCGTLSLHGIECYRASVEWGGLRQMGRPAILSLTTGRGDLRHVLLLGLSDTQATVDSAQGPVKVSLQDLDALWTGEFLMLWRRPIAETTLAPGSAGDSVLWLRERLAALQGVAPEAPLPDRFDEGLRLQVVAFQTRRGLVPDGVVGIRTLIALGDADAPRLADG